MSRLSFPWGRSLSLLLALGLAVVSWGPARTAGPEGQRKAAPPGEEVAYTITTVAGNGARGFGGDGGPATAAKLDNPSGVAVDRDGNVYVADYGNNRVRKVGPDGTITTVAGTGEPGFAGDGGPAAKAKLQGPYGVYVDAQGNLYVADQQNHRVRKIARDGTISTAAGDGRERLAGDGGPATAASLAYPDAMVVDDQGNLSIADAGNHRVRRVSADGTITTVAGTDAGYSGDGGPAVRARLNLPASLALDRKGNLYVGDLRNHAIRQVTTDGAIHTVAGTGERGFSGDGMPATRARLNEPGGVAVARDGSLLIADGVNCRVRRVGPDGVIRTIAGTGRKGHVGDGGPAAQAGLSILDLLAVDARGTIYVADYGNNRIRKLEEVKRK
jgi:sugar lactone lactonase YvrE